MATKYETEPGAIGGEPETESLEELQARAARRALAEETEEPEPTAPEPELPAEELELTVKVEPVRTDEFVCARCFLVHHRSRLAEVHDEQLVCRDCAA